MNKLRISNFQVFMGLYGAAIAYGHFVYTGLVFQAAGRDAWFCLIIGTVAGAGILYLHQKLAVIYPRQTIVRYNALVFGKWAGSVVSAVYVLFFLFIAALTIQELSIFMGLIYPKTPAQFFLVFEFLLVGWVVRAGGEVVTRVIQLLLPGLIVFGILATLFSMKDKDPSKLLPLLDHSFMNLMHGSLIYVVMFCDLVVFGMFYADVNQIEKLPKHGLFAAGLLGLMFFGPATGPIMVFGENLARVLPYPTYSQIQYIQISGLFERMDIVGVLLWTMGAYIRASVYVLGAARGISHMFQEQRETLYVLPVVVLVAGISLSLLPMSREEIHRFLFSSYPFIAVFVGVVLPLVTLGVGVFRTPGRSGRSGSPDSSGSRGNGGNRGMSRLPLAGLSRRNSESP